MTPLRIATIVGSLRRDSLNRKMAQAAKHLAAPTMALDIVEIGDLGFYNQDIEATPPPTWLRFREQVAAADGVVFFTPEYNRSVPGVLKNAVDVGSRPYGKSVFKGKPAAIMGVVPGALGATAAVQHLRVALVCNDMPVMSGPEAYVGGADKLFDAQGHIQVDSTRKFVEGFLQAFETWVRRFGPRS